MDTEKLMKTADLVKKILIKNPASRDNDMLLYEYVMNHYSISVKTSFDTVKQLVEQKKLPSFDSVSRARRKLQELNAELRPSDKSTKARDELEEIYIDFSRARACDIYG